MAAGDRGKHALIGAASSRCARGHGGRVQPGSVSPGHFWCFGTDHAWSDLQLSEAGSPRGSDRSLVSSFGGVAQGAQARIDQQNASGGVYGRKIQLAVGDDQSNPNDALTVTQGLVQQQGIFISWRRVPSLLWSTSTSGNSRSPRCRASLMTAGQNGQTRPAMTSWTSRCPKSEYTKSGWEWLIKILKADKITKLATLANGFSAASVAYANGIKAAAEAAGIQVVDEDNSLTETQTDLTPNAITMKKSGANGWVGLTSLFSEQALMTALHQQGATNIKAVLLGQYAGALLQPPLNSIDQGTIVPFYYKTPEISPAVGGQLVAALRKYTGYKGRSPPPNLGYYFGWASAQIAITGLQAAGKNLTVNSYLTRFYKQGAYTGGCLSSSKCRADQTRNLRGGGGR